LCHLDDRFDSETKKTKLVYIKYFILKIIEKIRKYNKIKKND